MPRGKQSHSPRPRSAEEILSDECVSTALTLLKLRRRVRDGERSAVQEVARKGAQIQHLAHTVEASIRQREEGRVCVFLFVVGWGGDQ